MTASCPPKPFGGTATNTRKYRAEAMLDTCCAGGGITNVPGPFLCRLREQPRLVEMGTARQAASAIRCSEGRNAQVSGSVINTNRASIIIITGTSARSLAIPNSTGDNAPAPIPPV